jgi:UDP-glucose 4-epimerase
VYGVSKLTGEGLLRETAARYGFSYHILRLFFVYGPRQFSGTGYPSVIVRNFGRILRGERPVIFGTGDQKLDYVHISDVVEAVIRAICAETRHDVVNIGSGKGTSIERLTHLMLRVAGSALKPAYAPPDWTAGTRRVADPSLARRVLAWSSTTSLETGLADVWRWMKMTGGEYK